MTHKMHPEILTKRLTHVMDPHQTNLVFRPTLPGLVGFLLHLRVIGDRLVILMSDSREVKYALGEPSVTVTDSMFCLYKFTSRHDVREAK